MTEFEQQDDQFFSSLSKSLASKGVRSIAWTIDFTEYDDGEVSSILTVPPVKLTEEFNYQFLELAERLSDFAHSQRLAESKLDFTYLLGGNSIQCYRAWIEVISEECFNKSWPLETLAEELRQYAETNNEEWKSSWLFFTRPRVGHCLEGNIEFSRLPLNVLEIQLKRVITKDACGYTYQHDYITQQQCEDLTRVYRLLLKHIIRLEVSDDKRFSGAFSVDYLRDRVACNIKSHVQNLKSQKLDISVQLLPPSRWSKSSPWEESYY